MKSMINYLTLLIIFIYCKTSIAERRQWDNSNDPINYTKESEIRYEFKKRHEDNKKWIDLGTRPFFLVDGMKQSKLKKALENCQKGPFYKSEFSIGHRGAPLQFPEHTKESYKAAARMGAGKLECDVTFTSDGELVCRHSQCDLHKTTNIISTPLNNKCTVPWNNGSPNPTTVKCCTSDITLAEFKQLKGKMRSSNLKAKTAKQYQNGKQSLGINLYSSRGTLMTHAESITFFKSLNVKFIPELISSDPSARLQIDNVFGNWQAYAQKMIDEYKLAKISASDVWPQSFDINNVLYWIHQEPEFGNQAILLDDRYNNGIDHKDASTFSPSMKEISLLGINIISPPMWMLLDVKNSGKIVPSTYAKRAKSAGLKIITWTFENSDLRNGSRTGIDAAGGPQTTWHYQFDDNPHKQAIQTDSDMYIALDVLAKDVGITGMFSDWPATVTYYANCMNFQ